MTDRNADIKNRIIESALPDIAFDGWTRDLLHKSARDCGYDVAMVRAVFPYGEKDAIKHFATMADDAMLKKLGAVSSDMKIRERIAHAVRTRFEWLEDHKEAERLAISYWARPLRKIEGAKLVWATADKIWIWAGDTATDYNRYTKRILLSGILTATALYWLNDESKGHLDSWAFLDRRIENALALGKIAAKIKKA
jgi:ubiquinone biosynthesis protein COQ9